MPGDVAPPADGGGENHRAAEGHKAAEQTPAQDVVTPAPKSAGKRMRKSPKETASTDAAPPALDETAPMLEEDKAAAASLPPVEGKAGGTADEVRASAGTRKKANSRNHSSSANACSDLFATDAGSKVLEEAKALGYELALRNLAGRAEIVSCGADADSMLQALKESSGLVNAAKHALLGA